MPAAALAAVEPAELPLPFFPLHNNCTPLALLPPSSPAELPSCLVPRFKLHFQTRFTLFFAITFCHRISFPRIASAPVRLLLHPVDPCPPFWLFDQNAFRGPAGCKTASSAASPCLAVSCSYSLTPRCMQLGPLPLSCSEALIWRSYATSRRLQLSCNTLSEAKRCCLAQKKWWPYCASK